MSIQEGLNVLALGGAKISGAYLFLDALNESKQSGDMLIMIKKLLQAVPSARIMISSTEELEGPFGPEEVDVTPMERGSISHDIQSYVETWIENDPHFAPLPRKLKSEITSTLQRNNDGMYVIYHSVWV